MSTTEPRKVVAIVGAGDAIGAAVGRRFAKGGYTVCLIRRSLEKAAPHIDAIVTAGGQAQAFSTAARDEGAVVALFETIERDVGPLEACLFNAGADDRHDLARFCCAHGLAPPGASLIDGDHGPPRRRLSPAQTFLFLHSTVVGVLPTSRINSSMRNGL